MEKQVKQRVVAEVVQLAGDSKAIVLTGFKGLTVEAETRLRRDIRAVDGEYRVVRNTLAKRALSEDKWSELRKTLSGTTAFASTKTDAVALMKALVDFAKDNNGLTIKCGVFEGNTLSKDDVKVMASLPSRDVLLGRLLGAMNSPLTGLMNVLTGPVRNFVQVVKAIADKKDGDGAV